MPFHPYLRAPTSYGLVSMTLSENIAQRVRLLIDDRPGSAAASWPPEILRQFSSGSPSWAWINWVTLFRMDEYLRLPAEHRRVSPLCATYVESLIGQIVPLPPAGDADLPQVECDRYRLVGTAIGLCCLGIGENGHLAFSSHRSRLTAAYVKLVK